MKDVRITLSTTIRVILTDHGALLMNARADRSVFVTTYAAGDEVTMSLYDFANIFKDDASPYKESVIFKNEITLSVPDTVYTVYWAHGKKEFIYGTTIEDAFRSKGYGLGAISAVDHYSIGEDDSYTWNEESKTWVKKTS